MKRLLAELSALLISSLIVISVVYYKIPSVYIQQAIAVLVAALLIINRVLSSRHYQSSSSNEHSSSSNKSLPFFVSIVLITLISAFLQLLVLSSGGFYSPFLILFHLFAISLSFLLNIRIAIGFLFFSIATLISGTALDNRLSGLFTGDPWSAVLIMFSFVAIIPLFQLISSSYRLKEAISKILSTQLKLTSAQLELTKKRDRSLLGGLSDLVVVTDLSLNILSLNEAAIRALKLSSAEALGKFFFDVIYLKDMNGGLVDPHYLPLGDAAERGTAHMINDLLLYTKNTPFPRKINLGIHPTRNLEGHIDQIVFIISNFYETGHSSIAYQNVEKAVLRHKSLLEAVKNELQEKNMKQLKARIELLGKTEEDILTATEIITQGIKSGSNLSDVANLMQHVFVDKKGFAEDLAVSLELRMSQEFTEQFTTLEIGEGKVLPIAFTSQYFTALIEPRWFDVLMEKITDLAILLSLKKNPALVRIFMSYDKESVKIDVGCAYPAPVPKDFEKMLLTEYYGSLGADANMVLGSGLEGYLIKSITTLMDIPLYITYNEDSQTLIFSVKLSKAPIHN